MQAMFAAVPWHWWLGAGLLLAGVGAVVALVAGYLALSKQRSILRARNGVRNTTPNSGLAR